MTTTIVVTGASGFIASHLVDQLLTKGYNVIGIDNMRTGREENLSEAMRSDKFRFLKADIRDDDLHSRIGGEIQTIYHLAAISSVKMSIEDPLQVNDVNVRGTLNILELARKSNTKRVVFSSSAAVYGNPEEMPIHEDSCLKPLSPYAASKIAAEMYIRSYSASYGIDSTILRFFNVYGPRQAYSEYSGVVSIFVNQAIANLPLRIEGDGEQTRSFVHVLDVVRSLILAGEKKSAVDATINISGINMISILRLAHLMKENIRDSTSEIVHGPPRIGDVKDSIGNIERAQKLLGFTPEIPLERGLQETAEWYWSHVGTK
ncbi:SDR family NAD(P)-dependent oxidoreductase [Candidatus Thorarchaeota archaeon]|nr:SDR family NAD(P)-dependent oxidoreductase [Candidatus Thorarchaeota archaeon]TFG94761.1 MAG: SDR family NAD(P)-dependent oxidoreductase [Candidatus Thorarchaeota archaeon]